MRPGPLGDACDDGDDGVDGDDWGDGDDGDDSDDGDDGDEGDDGDDGDEGDEGDDVWRTREYDVALYVYMITFWVDNARDARVDNASRQNSVDEW